MQAMRAHEGDQSAIRDRARPEAGTRRGRRRAADGRRSTGVTFSSATGSSLPAAARSRVRRRRRPARHRARRSSSIPAWAGATVRTRRRTRFEILGGPRDGTHAELIVMPEASLYPKPAGLSWAEAAAFPLAAVTAYRALFTRGGWSAVETVLVLGAGSGVSTFALQLAAQAGARVLVTSSSDEKIERAKELGAAGGVNYATTQDWPAAVAELGPVDIALDSVGSTWQQSLDSRASRRARWSSSEGRAEPR